MTEAEECAVRLFVSHYVDRLTASPGPVETQAVARGVAILLAERDAALADLARMKEEAGWRPIAEAPRDGTRVLVTYSPATGKPPICIAWSYQNSPNFSGWRRGRNKHLRFVPTHWRPLPTLPPLTLGRGQHHACRP